MKKLQVAPCSIWAQKLAAAHSDDLSAYERAELAAHIASCPTCAALQSMYRKIDALILSLPPIKPLFIDPAQLPPRQGDYKSDSATNNVCSVSGSAIRERKASIMKGQTSIETHNHSAVESAERSSTSRKSGIIRAMSNIAAILVICAIVGSFLILLTHRSPAPGGPVSYTPPAAPLAVYVGLDANDGTAYALRAADGTILWQHRIDQGGQNFAQEPTISHGVVYFSSNNGSIYALRASDGTLLWRHAMGGIPDQPVGSDGTVIYVGTLNGAVYALRTSDGSQVWRRPMPMPNAFVLAVVDGRVYVFSDGLYAIRANDGSVIWHNETVKFSSRSFVVSNGKVYIPRIMMGVDVLRASDGQYLHLLPIQGELASANGILYISGSEVYALRTSDDSILWHAQSDCLTGRLSVSNGVIYMSVSSVMSNSDSPQQGKTNSNAPEINTGVCALRTSDGKQLWYWHTSSVEGITIPRVAGGSVYFNTGVSTGNTEDGLYALRASDGALLWHVFQGKLLDGPAVG